MNRHEEITYEDREKHFEQTGYMVSDREILAWKNSIKALAG